MQNTLSGQAFSVADVITKERIFFHADFKSKKKVFETISQSFSSLSGEKETLLLYEKLVARERIGNTALGKGVAIPHCRLDMTSQLMGTFLLLKEPIDFDAFDNQNVDLVFALIVPQEENEIYLKFLARLAEAFSDSNTINQIRHAANHEALYNILCRI